MIVLTRSLYGSGRAGRCARAVYGRAKFCKFLTDADPKQMLIECETIIFVCLNRRGRASRANIPTRGRGQGSLQFAMASLYTSAKMLFILYP